MASVLNLSPRMEAIVNLCDNVKTIADIGCDHGYITAELILQEKAEKIIATDISEKSLNKAIRLCDAMNIACFVSFREGDGFNVVTKRDRVQLAVIAGMGGREIMNIMLNAPKKLNTFVLQPQSDVILLRQFLINNGFTFLVDQLVKEGGRYYTVMKVTKAKKPQQLSDIEIYFGFTNFRENYQVFYEYLVERYLFLEKFKSKFGELNKKNEEEWYFVNEALGLFGINGEQLLKPESEDEITQEDENLFEEENNNAENNADNE